MLVALLFVCLSVSKVRHKQATNVTFRMRTVVEDRKERNVFRNDATDFRNWSPRRRHDAVIIEFFEFSVHA